jgi:hypothetical protein
MNKFILLSFSFFVFSSFSLVSLNQLQACGCQAQQNLGVDTPVEQFTQTIIP